MDSCFNIGDTVIRWSEMARIPKAVISDEWFLSVAHAKFHCGRSLKCWSQWRVTYHRCDSMHGSSSSWFRHVIRWSIDMNCLRVFINWHPKRRNSKFRHDRQLTWHGLDNNTFSELAYQLHLVGHFYRWQFTSEVPSHCKNRNDMQWLPILIPLWDSTSGWISLKWASIYPHPVQGRDRWSCKSWVWSASTAKLCQFFCWKSDLRKLIYQKAVLDGIVEAQLD